MVWPRNKKSLDRRGSLRYKCALGKIYTFTAMVDREQSSVPLAQSIWRSGILRASLGLPCYKLLGGAMRDHIMPYASLQPEGNSVEQYGDSLVSWAKRAQVRFKAENGMCRAGPTTILIYKDDEQMTEIVRACRETVGPDFAMMVDVQYRWSDVHSCLRTVSRWDDLDLFFSRLLCKSTIWMDMLHYRHRCE